MKYYDPKLLTDEQKKELIRLIAKTDKTVIKLHDWIVGYDEFELIYILPQERMCYIDAGNLLKNTRPTTGVAIWKLLSVLEHDIPVDGIEFIDYLNNISEELDVIYRTEK